MVPPRLFASTSTRQEIKRIENGAEKYTQGTRIDQLLHRHFRHCVWVASYDLIRTDPRKMVLGKSSKNLKASKNRISVVMPRKHSLSIHCIFEKCSDFSLFSSAVATVAKGLSPSSKHGQEQLQKNPGLLICIWDYTTINKRYQGR